MCCCRRWSSNGRAARGDLIAQITHLAGEQIPLGSRLVMIADTYDAVCSDRSYRKALSKDEATRIIRDGAGGQFDPGLVPLFEKVVHDLPHPDEE